MRYQILLILIFIQSIAFVQKNATKYSRKELTKEIEQVKNLNLEMNAQIYDLTNQMTQMEFDMIKLEDKLVKQEELLVELNQVKGLDTNSTKQSVNPFGSGGNGGRGGSGKETFEGHSIKPRLRLNNVNLPSYNIDVDCCVALKLTIDAEGVITDCRSIQSITTCKSEAIINDVIARVKQQIKYNKIVGSTPSQEYYKIDFISTNHSIDSIKFVQNLLKKKSKKVLTIELEQVNRRNSEMNTQINDLTDRMIRMDFAMVKLEDNLKKQEDFLVELNQVISINTSSTLNSTDPFGSGGNGGRGGSGNGPFGGPENGAKDGGNGGVGTGKTRFRLNNVNLPQYDMDVDCRIGLKITINADGVITDCRSIKSVTTCKSQIIINDVISRVKQQVKYNKEKGATLTQVDYTIALNAR